MCVFLLILNPLKEKALTPMVKADLDCLMATWGFNFCSIAFVTWNQAVEA